MKDATVSVRVECNVKEEAEAILQNLGIPVSVLVNALYRQIIYKHGIPFPLTVPTKPQTAEEMTTKQLEEKLLHSLEQAAAGKGKPAHQVFEELERKFL